MILDFLKAKRAPFGTCNAKGRFSISLAHDWQAQCLGQQLDGCISRGSGHCISEHFSYVMSAGITRTSSLVDIATGMFPFFTATMAF